MKIDNSLSRVIQHLRGLALDQPSGTRLPSVRDVMRALRVSPVTVRHALEHLTHEGLLDPRPGQGTFVAERAAPSGRVADLAWQSAVLGPGRGDAAALGGLCLVPPDQARALNAGYLPADVQPAALLAAAAARAIRRPGVWGRMPVEGLADLRAWFAAATHGAYQPHEVTITPGTQAACSAAFRALAQPGDAVLIESPTYVGALAAAQAAGLRLVPVPTDADGVRPDLLEQALHRSGARVFYCQPTYANPTGAVLSADRRAAVLHLAVKAGAFIIEDDWARDFRLEGPEVPPLAASDIDGHVIYLRSLTKCAAPSLRIGAFCARGAALQRLRAARLVDDFFVPGILQETALQLVTATTWSRHLRTLREVLRQQRDAMVAALRRHLGPDSVPHVPAGGLHLWVRLLDGVLDLEVERRAAAEGVLVSAGRHWHPAEAAAPFLRLSYGGAKPEWVEACIGHLARLVAMG